MKWLIFFLGTAFARDYAFHPDIYKPTSFVPHVDYLAREVSYPPVAMVRDQVHHRLGITLKDRGEAHITVVTPPELAKLQPRLSLDDINKIAKKRKIERSKFDIVCLGEGQKEVLRTFFIVVNSPELVQLRHEISRAFQKKGGKPDDFEPAHFFPHITVGFTERDLHESDGVIKNRGACESH